MGEVRARRTANNRAHEPHSKFAPTYKKGDYVKVQLFPGVADEQISVWICVDHCDERHAILFGTLDSDPPSPLGKNLRRGAKLAASYWTVQEHQSSI